MRAEVRSDYVTEHAGAALVARRGLMDVRVLPQRSRMMYDMLTLAELEEMAPADIVRAGR